MLFRIFIILIIVLIVKDYIDGGVIVGILFNSGIELFSNVKDFVNGRL